MLIEAHNMLSAKSCMVKFVEPMFLVEAHWALSFFSPFLFFFYSKKQNSLISMILNKNKMKKKKILMLPARRFLHKKLARWMKTPFCPSPTMLCTRAQREFNLLLPGFTSS